MLFSIETITAIVDIKLIVAIGLAIIPFIPWFFIFSYRNSKRKYKLRLFSAFILAAGLSWLFHEYIYILEPYFTNLKSSKILDKQWLIFFYFILLFGLKEIIKLIITIIMGFRFFQNIDEVIRLACIVALGFSFGENIVLYFQTFSEGIKDYLDFGKTFVIYSFFYPPVYIFCSGILAYFYGLGLFASVELREKIQSQQWLKLGVVLRKVIPWAEQEVFRLEKVIIGLAIASFFSGFYFFVDHLEIKVNTVASLLGYQVPAVVNWQLIPFIGMLYFTYGSIYLFFLMDRKNRYKKQDLLIKK